MISEKIRIAQGTEGARRATGVPCAATSAQGGPFMGSLPNPVPDPEVPEKAIRRHFTAEYKLEVLRQADDSRTPGEIGSLLRKEGLYSSHLTTWRRQREAGVLSALRPKQRGRKASRHPLQPEVDRLRKENRRLQKRLQRAELINDIQKKISQILGIPLKNPELGEDD
jgi:transposase